MTPSLVIFDCDGTLVDSQHVIVAAMELAFAREGLAAPPREAILSIVGLSLPEAVWRLAQALPDVPEEAVTLRLTDGYKDAFNILRRDPAHEEPMYPGAHEGVLALAAREDMVLGIATGKSRRGVDRLIEKRGLQGCFATIQTADDAPSKPHPAMIEQAMGEVGVRAERTVMIGDTTFDIEMAKNAGVAGLGVSWGYHPPAHLERAGADYIAPDFDALLAAIGDHTGRDAP